VYDSPGYDTDGDGYRGKYRLVAGDTAYYTGDGVPDYQGPPAPPPPTELKYFTEAGKITIRWNGHESETRKDPFSFIPDFEGYRVYISRTLQIADFALIASRDNINYVRWQYQRASDAGIFHPRSPSTRLRLYDDLSHPRLLSSGEPIVGSEPLRFEIVSTLWTVEAGHQRIVSGLESNDKVNDTTTAYQETLGHDLVR
jgi:hypothetical protein